MTINNRTKSPPKNTSLSIFLFRELQGYRIVVILTVIITFLSIASEIMLAIPLKFIIDKVLNGIDPNFPFFHNIVMIIHNNNNNDANSLPKLSNEDVIIVSVALQIIVGALNSLLNGIQIYLASFIGNKLSSRLRAKVFSRLHNIPLKWHRSFKLGDIVQRVTGNVNDIQKFTIDGLLDLISSIFTLTGIVFLMFWFNWKFAILSLSVFPLLFIVIYSYTTVIKQATRRVAHSIAQLANIATEDMRAIVEIKAFCLQDREIGRFTKHNNSNCSEGIRTGYLQAQFTPIVGFITTASIAIMMGIGSFVAAGNSINLLFLSISPRDLTFGTLTVFLAYLKQLYQPIRNLSKLMNLATSASSGAERIQEILTQDTEDFNRGKKSLNRITGGIEYKQVFFGYKPDDMVLKGIDLHIEAGKKIALVGLSGSGKTTLTNLLMRFYKIDSGHIKIDGIDIQDYPLHTLRQHISVVLQESLLFEGSVLENIMVGNLNACKEEILEAAKKAQIHDTVINMPRGYDTLIQEGGINLSLGQRQRIAIARAILRNAPILILDEPTASLDVEAEAEVMHAVDSLIHGRTVIMISHRLSTLGHVDEIVVLDNGIIAESGNFEELIKSNGFFARMQREQNRYTSYMVSKEKF